MPDRINILLVGSGGREHALAERIKASPRCGTLYITHPENPGLASLGKAVDVPVSIREIYRLQQFCDKNKVGLVVIGPEDPLAEGYADKLAAPGRLVFGPTADAARLEADKAWCKQLLRSASVPTGEARVFTDPESARGYLESRVQDDKVLIELFRQAESYRDPENRRKWINQQRTSSRPIAAAYAATHDDLPVIKATGLAKGKGVIIPHTLAEALDAIERMMIRREFGDAGRTVVIEERLSGPEVSVLALVDGRNILVLPTAQDHKRLGDNDTGPNTGGMGAFSPSEKLDAAMMEVVEREILVPTVDALRRDGITYQGVLFAGLMLTPAGPKVLEYNVRFGDPECQAILARLKSDIVELMLAVCTGTLDQIDIQFSPEPSCCIVLASPGYPDAPKKGIEITGIEDASDVPNVRVYHAGTKREGGSIVTAGGRVLNVVATGATAADARTTAYAAAELIRFEGKQMRRDIGPKA
jgi:phosphoribosylamine--glycine ligase